MKFTLQFSLSLSILLFFMHLVAGLAVVLTQLSLSIKLLMMVVLTGSFLYYLARDALLLLPHSWCEIVLDQRITSVMYHSEQSTTGQVLGTSFINPYFVILRIKLERRRFGSARIIFYDALPQEQFRQLRVLLRLSAPA